VTSRKGFARQDSHQLRPRAIGRSAAWSACAFVFCFGLNDQFRRLHPKGERQLGDGGLGPAPSQLVLLEPVPDSVGNQIEASMLRDWQRCRHLDLSHLGDMFCNRTIYGIGGTVRAFRQNRAKGLPWDRCGVASADNGTLMRIAPVLLPYLRSPSRDLWGHCPGCAGADAAWRLQDPAAHPPGWWCVRQS